MKTEIQISDDEAKNCAVDAYYEAKEKEFEESKPYIEQPVTLSAADEVALAAAKSKLFEKMRTMAPRPAETRSSCS